MSNYTEAEISATDAQAMELRRRCQEQFSSTASSQAQLSQALMDMSDGFHHMQSGIADLSRRQAEMQQILQDSSWDIHAAEANLSALNNEIQSLAQEIQSTSRLSTEMLLQGQIQQGNLSSQLGVSQAQLQSLADRAMNINERVNSLTRELDQHWQRAEQIEGLVEALKQQHTKADAQLKGRIQNLEDLSKNIQNLSARWSDLSQHLNQLSLNMAEHQRKLVALSEAAINSPALFALLENMQDYSIQDVQVFPEGIEVFFRDAEGRSILLASRRSQTSGTNLLNEIEISLDLEGFDVGGEHELCDLENERLSYLMDADFYSQNHIVPKKHKGQASLFTPKATNRYVERGRSTSKSIERNRE